MVRSVVLFKMQRTAIKGKRGKGVTDLNYEGDSECVQSRLTRVEAEGQVRTQENDDNTFHVAVAT